MRPANLKKNGTLYWVIRLRNTSGALVDADSTPTVAIRKNGASVGDAVTVTKRTATTGIYDCSYNPAGEVDGDQFTVEETVVISSITYSFSWAFTVDELSTDIATAVWANSTRTLSSFGTLAADAATAVWASGTRTLTAISDSSGITTLLTRIVGTLASGTHNPQSGDAFARLGAPAGASVSADVANNNAGISLIKAKTDNLPSDPADASDIASLIAAVPAAVWAYSTRTLSSFGTLVADVAAALNTTSSGSIAETCQAILNRVGAFSVSGNNTILGFLRAIMRKDASLPSDVGGTYAVGTDSLEAQADGGSSGTRTVTITVNDGTTVIQGARVRLTKGAESFVRTTNVSGVATFNVDDGTWTIGITANGYSYAGTTLVVDGNETATYSMTVVSITAPPSPGLCTVRFEVRESDGDTPIQNAVVKAVLDQNCVTDGVLLSNAIHSGTTGSDGICDLVLVQSKSIIRGSKCYAITVVDPANTSADPLFRFYGTVPNETTAYASELIPRNR